LRLPIPRKAIDRRTLDSSALSLKVQRNLAAMGDAGSDWLTQLPSVIGELEQRWQIIVGAVLPNATEACVALAVSVTGHGGVLKIPLANNDKVRRERSVLQAPDGRGYARLLHHDPQSGALLLELVGPQLHQLGFSIESQIEIICATLANAWRVSPAGLDLQTGAEKAHAMAAAVRTLSAKLETACPAHTITIALRFAQQRAEAFDPNASVLGHGDAHSWNALADPNGSGFRFVDPDGFFIEPAHDLSISLREWSDDLLAGDPVRRGQARCSLLERLTGVSASDIWQWGVGSRDIAAPFLAVANAWAAAEPA
jgi:streptomycin 6-kinase